MKCDTCGKDATTWLTMDVVTWKILEIRDARNPLAQLPTGVQSQMQYEVAPLEIYICQACWGARQAKQDREKVIPGVMAGGLGLLGLLIIGLSKEPWESSTGLYLCSGISLLLFFFGLVNVWQWISRRWKPIDYLDKKWEKMDLPLDSDEVSIAVYNRLGQEASYSSVQDWRSYQVSKSNPVAKYLARPRRVI